VAFALSARLSATGFFINQQSVRGLGRVDAGNTVAADELGTIFFNPAGLTKVVHDRQDRDRIRIAVAAHLIVPRSDQRNQGSAVATPGTLGAFVPLGGGNGHDPTGPTPVPNIYIAAPVLNNTTAVGFGLNFPFGLKTRFDPAWHGRYDAIEASLRTYNVSLVAARRIGSRMSVGGGLDLQRATTMLATAIPNPLAPGGPTVATDGRIETTGHDPLTPGFNVGVIYDITGRTRTGFHYRSAMTHEIEGTSDVRGLQGPLAVFNGAVGSAAELKLPAIATLGVRHVLARELAVLGELEWFDWSTFREVRIRFADGRPDAVRPANYRDAYAVAVGAEYPVTRGWIARGGVHWDTTPTVDGFRDTTVPDAERRWLGLGTTFQMRERLNVDLAFNHVFFDDTTIALTRTFFDGTPLATAARINNRVSTVLTTIAVDVRYRF
jgi:long-chain fatty acid transport protein